MTSTMMRERTGMGVPGMGMPGVGTTSMGAPAAVPPVGSYLMVPRCTFKVEKCPGGFRLTCACDDKAACAMVQNLCTMLAGGLCGCCVTYNGLPVYQCCLTMGLCRCEMTADGFVMTCTSGDAKCGEMIQACGDCLRCMLDAGCVCCFLMNNTPVCCGCAEQVKAAPKAKAGK